MSDKLTTVVNLRRGKFDVYIGRPGRGHEGYFGNPYPLNECASGEDCITKYRAYFYERLKNDCEFWARVNALRGKVLGCFCKPRTCHGDVIAEYLNCIPLPKDRTP